MGALAVTSLLPQTHLALRMDFIKLTRLPRPRNTYCKYHEMMMPSHLEQLKFRQIKYFFPFTT